MKTTEKSPPDLAEIGRLAVQEYLAKRAYADYVHKYNFPTCPADIANNQRGRDLNAAQLRTELATEDAIFDYLASPDLHEPKS